MTPTPITKEAVRRALPPSRQGLELRVFDELDSTNTYAKGLVTDTIRPSEPILIIARHQTAGRGRLGRSFYSPADTGLYMTLLYPTHHSLSCVVGMTGAAAVAVVRAIEALTDKRPAIKWVNDVYLDGGKACGILTEAVTPPDTSRVYVAIGIGINLSTQQFPEGLRAPATALASSDETPPDASTLAAAITCELLSILENDPYAPAVVDTYRAHAWLMGELVLCTQGNLSFEATVEGIENDYALRVRRADGSVLRLSSGEISVKHLPSPSA